MAAKSWKKTASIVEELLEEPRRFEFFQAVRLLEQYFVLDSTKHTKNKEQYKYPVSKGIKSSHEKIKFANNYELTFQTSEIKSIETTVRKKGRSETNVYEIVCSFMGLAGSGGIMPYQLSELILKRIKSKDHTLSKFLDLINHRTLSLFYQSWVKYRVPIAWERAQLFQARSKDDCQLEHILYSLMGLETQELKFNYINKKNLLGYSGILSNTSRSMSNLESMLKDYYQLPVDIEQFVLERYRLNSECLTRIGCEPATMNNNQLSGGAFIGDICWMSQNKFKVLVSLSSYEQLESFAPGNMKLLGLIELVEFYAGIEMSFEIVFVIRGEKIPPLQLSSNNNYRPTLGWNSYLKSKSKVLQQEFLKIRITAKL